MRSIEFDCLLSVTTTSVSAQPEAKEFSAAEKTVVRKRIVHKNAPRKDDSDLRNGLVGGVMANLLKLLIRSKVSAFICLFSSHCEPVP